MLESQPTMSLYDVANLAQVQRPVVTMWMKRTTSHPFPTALSDGRFPAGAVVDWLEQTGRGNNPNARADLAIQLATSAGVSPEQRRALAVLITLRALVGERLSASSPDELLDLAEELDPDDEFLFSEVQNLDLVANPDLVPQADEIVDAAWNAPAALERLVDAQTRASDERLHPDLVALMAELCRSLMSEESRITDLEAASADVVLEVVANEDSVVRDVCVPTSDGSRAELRRYRVHDVAPEVRDMDSWSLDPEDLCLVRVSDPSGLALIDETTLRMGGASLVLAVGPASVLTDQLPAEHQAQRDGLIRDIGMDSAVLRAAVRLPAGLTRSGSRQHLALWLLGPAPRNAPVWVGDLSGAVFDAPTRQRLLDDLLAVVDNPGGRGFSVLHPVSRPMLVTQRGSLVSAGSPTSVAPVSVTDDAARIRTLGEALARPLPQLAPLSIAGTRDAAARRITLGAAEQARLIRVGSGARISDLPKGTMPLWTPQAVAAGVSDSCDLVAFTRAHPRTPLTRPGDVIFTWHGTPAAVLDRNGGAAVCFPARTIRVTSSRMSPAAIVDAINAVPAGNKKWRTWSVTESQIDVDLADTILGSFQDWEAEVRVRQTQLEELRLLVTRSVLSGAIELSLSNEEKGM